jgi:hypothetical protein
VAAAEEGDEGCLKPVDEGRFVEARAVLVLGDDDVRPGAGRDHLAGSLGEAGLIPIDRGDREEAREIQSRTECEQGGGGKQWWYRTAGGESGGCRRGGDFVLIGCELAHEGGL